MSHYKILLLYRQLATNAEIIAKLAMISQAYAIFVTQGFC